MWQAALLDAGIDATDARLIELQGKHAPNRVSAMTWVRGDRMFPEDLGGPVGDLNEDHVRGLRRVAIWVDRSPEGSAGLLRHELEHTNQYERFGKLLQQLHARAESILIQYAGGIEGSAQLYNKIPMEVDANAAASAFVRSIFGDALIDSRVANGDEHIALFRRQAPPEPIESLRTRMEGFVSTEAGRISTEFALRSQSDD